MTTQAIVRAQGFFKVDGPNTCQACGFAERFGRNVHRELLARHVQRGDCHASAIERNAVTQGGIAQVVWRAFDGKPLAMAGSLTRGENVGDTANAGDDSCKHPAIFAGNATGRVWSGHLKLVATRYSGQHAQIRADLLDVVKRQPHRLVK